MPASWRNASVSRAIVSGGCDDVKCLDDDQLIALTIESAEDGTEHAAADLVEHAIRAQRSWRQGR